MGYNVASYPRRTESLKSIHKELNSRLTLVNACYLLLQNVLSYPLLQKNLIKIHTIVIMSVVLYEGETLFLPLMEYHKFSLRTVC
jgi:hypothetical protein